MKKFLSILLAVILILGQIPDIGLADGKIPISSSDIIISKALPEIAGGKKNIYSGDEFNLSIELQNTSSYHAKNVMLGVEKASNFQVLNSGSKVRVSNQGQLGKASDPDTSTGQVTFTLKYNGGENTQLPLTIYYTLVKEVDGEEITIASTIEDYIDISQAIAEDKSEAEADDKKYIPNISITSSKTTLGESGDSISLPIEIKNDSGDSAYNITTTIELDGDSPLYIDGSGNSNTNRLHPGKSKSLSFKIKLDKKAEDKTYPIKVNFHFYNQKDEVFRSSDTLYIKITDSKESAKVVIRKLDIKPNRDIVPGENLMVGFEIENTGDSPAKDLKVSLKGLSSNGFSLASGLTSQAIPILERGKPRYIFFQLKSSRRLTSGNHDLEINLSYKDMKNQEFLDENKFFIPVASNKNQSANLIIQNISSPTGAVGLNRDVNISFTLRNQGQSPAEKIIIKAESTDQSGLVAKSVSTIKLNSLAPNTNEKIDFTFLTTRDAATKNYPINISVEYEDDLTSSEEKSSLNQFLGIFVLGPDDPEDAIKSTPRLIIDRYDFQPKLVRAGENFQMNLSFFNTNSAKTVKNIKIFLTAEANSGGDPTSPSSASSVFTPVDSSNTFYIDSIRPKGRVEKTITMFTIPDAVAKTHMITANFEYEDAEGEEYTATELIGVPVVQKSRLEVGQLNYMEEAFLGETSPISLEFYNTGKVTLYNMMVRLEGDFQTENGSYYIGNFENGSSEFFEGYVIPSQPGPLDGAVVFTYEDSTGQEQEVRKDFSLNVIDTPHMEDFPDDYPLWMVNPVDLKDFLNLKFYGLLL